MNAKSRTVLCVCVLLCLTVPSTTCIPMHQTNSTSSTAVTSSLVTGDGDILYVGGSGPDNYTSIQAAINDASDGDTVFVYSGVYNESILVDKRIDVVGAERDTTIINAAEGGYAVNITADGVHISTFTIQNGAYPYGGVQFYRGEGNMLSRCRVYNNRDAISISASHGNTIRECNVTGNTVGIDIHDGDDNVVTACTISDNNGGIYLTQSDGNTVSRCGIHGNPWVGISLESSSGNTIAGNAFVDDGIRLRGETPSHFIHDIVDNTVNGLPFLYLKNQENVVLEDLEAGGVLLVNCSDAVLRNVTVTDGDVGIAGAWCHNGVISGCTLSNNDEGISLFFSSNITLSGNTIPESQQSGISLHACDRIAIHANHLSHTGGYALYLRESCHNNVSMNEIRENSEGILLHSYADYNTVYGNEVTQSTFYGISIQGGCYNEVTHNVVRGSREWCGICTAKGWTQGNVISKNEVTANNWAGIEIEGIENSVSHNNISQNTRYGIMLSSFLGTDCKRNVIQENNFRENGNHAFFDVSLLSLNLWSHNYWQGWPSSIPKPIAGECRIPITPGLGIRVPWLNVDLHPAREPHRW